MTQDTADVLARWVEALEAELELPAGSVDLHEILDLARDAAHHVARPAAPVTTYLVGYAHGLAAASSRPTPDDVVAERASRLALGWQPDRT
ncbi:DUF6457 domain-containing protein [Isoptericola rhizosphaerae]|uniref:DUF6457 domain-containing protein n=1 Tax=Isoptericola rhizosphaerae TaxID=3377837 RepID=UPI00383BC7D9